LLQPDVVMDLGVRVRGPIDLLQLREQVEQLQHARAAQPPLVECVIAFKPETWEQLNGLAAQLTTPAATMTPAQLVTLLVESSLAGLTNGQR
jgi:hypothetical protein